MALWLRMRISILIFVGHASNESAVALLETWAPRLPKMGTPQRSTMVACIGIGRLSRLSCYLANHKIAFVLPCSKLIRDAESVGAGEAELIHRT